MEQRELVIRLIKDDLINTYLIDGFAAMRLCSENYRLNLSDTIFKIIGIEDGNEELFNLYLKKCHEMVKLDIVSDRHLLDNCATELYEILMESKI